MVKHALNWLDYFLAIAALTLSKISTETTTLMWIPSLCKATSPPPISVNKDNTLIPLENMAFSTDKCQATVSTWNELPRALYLSVLPTPLVWSLGKLSKYSYSYQVSFFALLHDISEHLEKVDYLKLLQHAGSVLCSLHLQYFSASSWATFYIWSTSLCSTSINTFEVVVHRDKH